MIRRNVGWFAACLSALFACAGSVQARDIGGTISTTLTITEDSQLVDDVTCAVENGPCIVFGAPGITFDLNGFAITGLADAETACAGGGVLAESGIEVRGQDGVIIRGPGVVRQNRGVGIWLQNSTGGKITGVTTSTTCYAGIFMNGVSGYEIEGNVSVRNGHMVSPCGGI